MSAIERLKRLGLLEVKGEKWICRQSNTTLGSDFTSMALKKMQAQILTQAGRALEAIPVERRDQTSMTMAVDSRRLAMAKEKIKDFRRELSEFLEGDGEKDTVFQLSIGLFPISQNETPKLSKERLQ